MPSLRLFVFEMFSENHWRPSSTYTTNMSFGHEDDTLNVFVVKVIRAMLEEVENIRASILPDRGLAIWTTLRQHN